MAAPSAVALPPGFQLEGAPSSGAPAPAASPPAGLPPGFQLEGAAAAPSQQPQSFAGQVGHTLAGEGELAGTALANIPGNAIASLVDRFRRMTGGNPNAPVPAWLGGHPFQPGQAGQDLEHTVSQLPPVQAAGHAANAVDQFLQQHLPAAAQDAISEGGSEANAGLNLLPVAGAAEAVGKLLGGAVPEGGEALGLQTGKNQPIARAAAGSSALPALQEHVTTLGNTVAAAEAAVPQGTTLSSDALTAAREAPNSVYNRLAQALPENGQLDPQAQAEVQSAGQPAGGRMTAGSPQAQPQIEALRSQLLDPNRTFTGDQMVNELRGLRQEGYGNIGSDDVSNQQLGQAQLGMARAVEGHILRNIPSNSGVTPDQFLDARSQLAKNFTVQGALRGNDVDLRALGRIQRSDPGLLTGGLQTLADFAENNPQVAGLPNRFNSPGIMRDIAGVSLAEPATWARPFVGALGRRMLTGSTPDAVAAAQRLFPGNAAERFAPVEEPLQLTPPAGTPGVTPSQIPLGQFDQGPGARESLELTQPPGNPVVPAQRSLGPLPQDSGAGSGPIQQRFGAPEAFAPNAAGASRLDNIFDLLNNNGSSENNLPQAGSLEGINRAKGNIVETDGDTAEPVLADVTQVDRNPRKGHIFVNADTGQLVNSGGMRQSLAQGILNRFLAQQPLGRAL